MVDWARKAKPCNGKRVAQSFHAVRAVVLVAGTRCGVPGRWGGRSPQPFGLYAITSISTFASTISRASVVERAGLPFGKYSR